MAKFRGSIGYVKTEETAPGVHTEVVTKRTYSGDVIRSIRRWENSQGINDNLAISNQFSIIADPYAMQNFSTMRFIEWNGVCWKITAIEHQKPRLILTVGGVYNGPTN